jgi:5-oxoprolinase (ATP-hydrolysing) subunit A
MTAYQIGALQAIARYAGISLTHMKPHGALANMAAVDESYAMAMGRAIKTVDRDLIYVGLAGSQMIRAAQKLGLPYAREGFADRSYEDDGNLTPRSTPGSVYTDPKRALDQALRLIQHGEVISLSGTVVRVDVDTICLHGDAPSAVAVARGVRQGIDAAGIELVTLPQMVNSRQGAPKR